MSREIPVRYPPDTDNHSQLVTIERLQQYLRRVTYEHCIAYFKGLLSRHELAVGESELAEHIPYSDDNPAVFRCQFEQWLGTLRAIGGLSLASQEAMQQALLRQFADIGSTVDLLQYESTDEGFGLCEGLGVVKAVMYRLGPEADSWWHEVITEQIHRWDAKYPERLDAPLVLRSKPGEVTTLRALFDKVINYVVFNHAVNEHLGGVLSSEVTYHQNAFRSSAGLFEYLTADGAIIRASSSDVAISDFSPESLRWFLQNNRQHFGRGIHVACSKGHLTALCFEEARQRWLFYNADGKSGHWRVFDSEGFDHTRVPMALVDAIFDALETDGLVFQGAMVGGSSFQYDMSHLDGLDLHFRVTKEVLFLMADQAPQQLIEWMVLAKTDEKLAEAIAFELDGVERWGGGKSVVLMKKICELAAGPGALFDLFKHPSASVVDLMKVSVAQGLDDSGVDSHALLLDMLRKPNDRRALLAAARADDDNAEILAESIVNAAVRKNKGGKSLVMRDDCAHLHVIIRLAIKHSAWNGRLKRAINDAFRRPGSRRAVMTALDRLSLQELSVLRRQMRGTTASDCVDYCNRRLRDWEQGWRLVKFGGGLFVATALLGVQRAVCQTTACGGELSVGAALLLQSMQHLAPSLVPLASLAAITFVAQYYVVPSIVKQVSVRAKALPSVAVPYC